MSASKAADGSVLRTGLSQFALSIAAFGTLAAGAIGAAFFFGDDDAGGPRIELALYSEQNGPPPLLKNRSSLEALDAQAAGEPTLGVEYSDEIPEGGGDGAEANMTVTEIGSNAVAAPTALPRAPISGYFERTAAGDLPKIGPDGRTPAEAYARPFNAIPGTPRVSLIVGGLGMTQKHTLAAINELPPEVTLSFVPYANDLQGWINRARAAGHEVLLELPMEAYDYPNVDSGPQTLLTSAKPEENLRRLNILMGKATGYFGVTNYQGARFATDAAAATPVMKALKDRGLLFLHDGAAARSVLPQAANQTGLDFTVADRIVDAELSADAIDRELLALEALAIQNGKAIGVGFAYPVTIEQFRIWAEGLKAKGYQLAPASASAGVETRAAKP
ncbi:MAG TPA: divergent polysaccharide deacetylase family protein [Hyphomonadaceae bacterium]|nr:divergent polysaccharide deacetylase family protein [Hyphomonadaceae bacterium]